MSKWKTIDSAPKDGTVFISYWGNMPCFVAWIYSTIDILEEKEEITGKGWFKKTIKRKIKREIENNGFRVLVNGGNACLLRHGQYAPFTPKYWCPLPNKWKEKQDSVL